VDNRFQQITINAAYLRDCRIAYPADCARISKPMPAAPVVWLRHRSGTYSQHPLMADRRTIGSIGYVCDPPNHDKGFGKFPNQEDLVRI
jgi:hypothetical protein